MQKRMFDAYRLAGAKPDIAVAHAWDPAMLTAEALRSLGRDAGAEQIRAYLAAVSNWGGVNGVYDFAKTPQRGLDADDAV